VGLPVVAQVAPRARGGWAGRGRPLGGGAEPADLQAVLAASLRPRTVARAGDEDGEGFGVDSTSLLTSLAGGFSSWSGMKRRRLRERRWARVRAGGGK
jgi:hypothetical protein